MNKQAIPFINIIGLTAFTSEKDKEKCFKSGMKRVLSKPLDIKELKKILSFEGKKI